MKKNLTLLTLLGACIITSVNAQTVTAPTSKKCGVVEMENIRRAQDPEYDQKRAEVEKAYEENLQKIEMQKNAGVSPYAQYTIPVVFHVIYKTPQENVSDAQVKAALSQLNLDWSRQNADKNNTPASWLPVAADMQIQFCLATKDNNGNPTTGIIRKQTTVTEFNLGGNESCSESANGGDDPWNVNKYFNIYTCNLAGGVVGYASYPPIYNQYVCVMHSGTVGSFLSPGYFGVPYGYGRTLTHEIGHSFNLAHIWADDGGGCSQDDGVSDTPKAGAENLGCPSGVKTDACSPTAPGLMYQNYMDYTDDNCLNLSTTGQKNRSQSAVATHLMALANGAATLCGVNGISESPLSNTISLFPNPTSGEVSINTVYSNISSMDVKVYNAMGETVLLKSVNIPASKETKIDLSSCPNGIYLFEINAAEGNMSKKVIINR